MTKRILSAPALQSSLNGIATVDPAMAGARKHSRSTMNGVNDDFDSGGIASISDGTGLTGRGSARISAGHSAIMMSSTVTAAGPSLGAAA